MSTTPNKGYNNQATGSDVGTWGIVNNQNFTAIDLNFGGRKNANVAGNTNVNVSIADAQNAYHLLTGLLTGNIQYILPALGGFYFIQNNTTGAFTVTVIITGGTSNFVAPQGQTAFVFSNPDNLIPTGLINNIFVGQASTGGTANAQTLAAVTPGAWALAVGNIIYATAGHSNNASMTFAGPDGAAKAVERISSLGLVALTGGEVITGNIIALFWDGTEYVLLNPSGGLLAANNLSDVANNVTALANLFGATPLIPSGATGTTQAVNDASTKLATTAFVNRASSIATQGYVELPSGVFLQWGTQSVGANTTSTFSFPIAFPTNVFAFVVSQHVNANTGVNANESTGGNSISTSQYQIRNGSGAGTINFDWFATGN